MHFPCSVRVLTVEYRLHLVQTASSVTLDNILLFFSISVQVFFLPLYALMLRWSAWHSQKWPLHITRAFKTLYTIRSFQEFTVCTSLGNYWLLFILHHRQNIRNPCVGSWLLAKFRNDKLKPLKFRCEKNFMHMKLWTEMEMTLFHTILPMRLRLRFCLLLILLSQVV